jgi:hypothetical protein
MRGFTVTFEVQNAKSMPGTLSLADYIIYNKPAARNTPRPRSGVFYTPSIDTGKLGIPGYRDTRVPILPFPAIVVNQRLARYRSTRYAATKQLRSLGTQQTRRAGSNADQLHHMPLICAIAADQHVLNMTK